MDTPLDDSPAPLQEVPKSEEPKSEELQEPKPKKQRTEAQIRQTEIMKQKRRESLAAKQKKDPAVGGGIAAMEDYSRRLNTGLLYDLEVRRKKEAKDLKWGKLIDDRFESFESRIENKIVDIMGRPIEHFLGKSDVKKQEKLPLEKAQPKEKVVEKTEQAQPKTGFFKVGVNPFYEAKKKREEGKRKREEGSGGKDRFAAFF